MPQPPILSRTAIFIRQRSTGTLRQADFNLVTTSLGAMVESRTLYRDGGAMKNDDPTDSDFNDIRILDESEVAFFSSSPLCNLQWPRPNLA